MAYMHACCAVDLLGWAADRGDGGGVVPKARAARGGRAKLLICLNKIGGLRV